VTEAVAAAHAPLSNVAEKALVFRDHRISIPIVVVGADR
jgi:hypothetical protein